MALGRPAWREVRHILQSILSASNLQLRDNAALREKVLIPLTHVTNHIPTKIGDYTDFYASKEHATNVGTMFRGKDNALMPNWQVIPMFVFIAGCIFLWGTMAEHLLL
jgi:fumarylacetoacetase